MSFELLPPEIHLMILNYLPYVQTLFASIAAIPQLNRLYRPRRYKILAAVVDNQFGPNLSKAVSLAHSFDAHIVGTQVDECFAMRKMLETDSDVNALIRECVYLQFQTRIQPSDNEFTRLRRGMYNVLQAATLFRKPIQPQSVKALYDFYHNLSAVEILEFLYILHCLRDLAKVFLRQMLVLSLVGSLRDSVRARECDQDWCWEQSAEAIEWRERWRHEAPWVLTVRELNYMTTLIRDIELTRFKPDDVIYDGTFLCRLAPYVHFNPSEEKLWDQIPEDYTFPNLGRGLVCPEFQPHSQEDLIRNISRGFMIWDNENWTQLHVRRGTIFYDIDAAKLIENRKGNESEVVEEYDWSKYQIMRGKICSGQSSPQAYADDYSEHPFDIRDSQGQERWLLLQNNNEDANEGPGFDEVTMTDDRDKMYNFSSETGTLILTPISACTPRRSSLCDTPLPDLMLPPVWTTLGLQNV